MNVDPAAPAPSSIPSRALQRHQPARLGRLTPGPLYWVILVLLRAVVRLVVRNHLHVEGRENVPRTGGVLLISNHLSSADPPLLGAASPRPLHFMAKVEWFKHRLLGFLAWHFLCFPVVRHTADRGALRHTLDLLARGQAVAIYPEGTRSEDLRLHHPEAGVGFLARHAGVPIVPVATWGGENVLQSRGYHLPRAAETHVVFGLPFTLPATPMTNQEAAELMMARIAALLPPRYRGYLDALEDS